MFVLTSLVIIAKWVYIVILPVQRQSKPDLETNSKLQSKAAQSKIDNSHQNPTYIQKDIFI